MFDTENKIDSIKTVQELEDIAEDIADEVALLTYLLGNPNAFANYHDNTLPWHAVLAMVFPDRIETLVDYTIEHQDVFNRFFPTLSRLTIYAELYPPEQVEKLISFILNNSASFERLVGGDIRRLINFTKTFPDHKDMAFEKADLLNDPEKFKQAIYNGQALLLSIEAFPGYAQDFLDKTQILTHQEAFDHFIGAFHHPCFLKLTKLFPQFINELIKRTHALESSQAYMSSIFYSAGVHMFFDSVLQVFSAASIQCKERFVEIVLSEPTLFNYYVREEQHLEALSSLSPGCKLLKIRPLEKVKSQLIAEANTRNAANIIGMWTRSGEKHQSIARIGYDTCYRIAGFFAPSEKEGDKIAKEHFGKPASHAALKH